jgi:hypothetical protein
MQFSKIKGRDFEPISFRVSKERKRKLEVIPSKLSSTAGTSFEPKLDRCRATSEEMGANDV